MPAAVVWTVFARLLGLVYLIIFVSLRIEIEALAGSRGIAPIAPRLARMRADFPPFRRFLYFPTLFWIDASDTTLRALPLVGCAAALCVVAGIASFWAFLVCWVVYLSLDLAANLEYPWEAALYEAGFLALFLPAAGPPLPVIAWAYRWLLFRIVFGFGKMKFAGPALHDLNYLRGFLIGQLMPSRPGWYAHHLPRWILQSALVAMFLVEIVVPFFIFFTGAPRLVAAVAIAALMAGIQLTGNFGSFNLLTAILCLPLLDLSSSVFVRPLGDAPLSAGALLAGAVGLTVLVGGLVNLPFNSWCSQAWPYWPFLERARSPVARAGLAILRFLQRLRIVNAYGVFPPVSCPPAKFVPVIEGSRDGATWEEYRYRFMPVAETDPPRFVAPYTPRLDHHLTYDGLGLCKSDFFVSVFGSGIPYQFSPSSTMERLVQRLLEGGSPVAGLFSHNPFPPSGPPPAMIRVGLYMLQPVSLDEHARTGAWWRRRYIGPHLLAVRRDDSVWDEWLPDPELFHPDDLAWRARAPALRRPVDAREVDRFWSEFLPTLAPFDPEDWSRLPAAAARVRETWDGGTRRGFERVLGRLSADLVPLLQPAVDLPSDFHVAMLSHRIIARGRECYEAVRDDPSLAVAQAKALTPASGLFLFGVFRERALAYTARKRRLTVRFPGGGSSKPPKGVPGFALTLPFLETQLEAPGEDPPTIVRTPDGEWVIGESASREAPRVRADAQEVGIS
jgi:(2Fe-2S) ferredoxin